MSFNYILGQERPLNIVRRMLNARKIPHAFLFTGTAGVGKHTTARALAKALNCTQHTADFCNTCTSCKKIDADMHPDCTLIRPEKNVIKIDQIRNLIRDIAFAPVEALWRVVIIDQAETMNREAANCLLKTLEEPPSATVIILIANGTIRLLPTIQSRCQKISFAPLSKQDIQTLLEKEGVAQDQARTLAQHSHGSLHQARMLLDTSLFDDFTNLTSTMIDAGSAGQRLDLAGTLCKSPERLSALLMLLLEWLRDVLLFRHGADTLQFFNTQQDDFFMRAAKQIEPCRLNKKIVQVSQLMTAQDHNINVQLGLEALLLS